MSINRKLIKLLNQILFPAERYLCHRFGEEGIIKYPPLFIIGAPRSGTTLVYKVLAEAFNLSYMSNLNAHFYRLPTISTFLFKRLIQISYNKAYESNFGFIPGLASPSENGEFWYQWFPKDTNVYVAPHQTPADKLLQLRHAIGAFSYINVSSTIYKNVYNSMRIAPICEAIPNVCFIICKRDYVENGLSILNARKKNNGDLDKWWSLKPKEIASLTQRNYAEQIAGQLYYTYQQIATDRKRFGKEKFLKIQYEEFCKDVTGSLNLIKMFLNRNGIKIKERNNVPSFFSIRKANRVRIDERQKISDAIQFYFSVIENLK